MTGRETSRRFLGWTGVVLLTLAAVAAPFPYGKVLPAGKLLLELPFLGAAIVAVLYHRGKRIGGAVFPLVCVTLLATAGLLQAIPLGERTIARLSPASADVFESANRVLRVFGKAPVEARISIVPADTLSAAVLVATYGLAFYAAAVLLDTKRRRSVFAGGIVAAALCQAGAAALMEQPVDRIHGAFVNPNHFAGYLEMSLALAFGFLWAEVLTGRDRTSHAPDRFHNFEQRVMHLGGRALVWGGIAAGIALTKSRAGILVSLLGTAALFLAALSHPREKRRRHVAVIGALLLCCGLAFVAISAGRYPLLRFIASDPRDPSSDTRVALWRVSTDAWREFPLFGSGLGTFREAFRRVQPAEMNFLVEQAHNDSLQMLVTGGILGFVLSAGAALGMLGLLFRGSRRQRHRAESAMALAAAGALFMLLLHGIVEFNFSVPAIPATLSAICGMGWAAARHQPVTEAQAAAEKAMRPVPVAGIEIED